MKIEIKRRFNGMVIFSHDCENNSIAITAVAAIAAGASLANADLYNVNLANADLANADLANADLSRANLTGANLTGAKLTNAYLADADLANADLSRANLTGAKLTDANLSNLTNAYLVNANILCFGDRQFIFTRPLDRWPVGFTKTHLRIGCENHSIAEWGAFSDSEIALMNSSALVWWKKWKDHIFKTIELTLLDK